MQGKLTLPGDGLSRITGLTDIAHASIAEKGSLLRKL
jgi:hypothetical protein